MLVRFCLAQCLGITNILRPCAGICDKEPHLWTQILNVICFITKTVKCGIRYRHTTIVCQIFPQCEFTVCKNPGCDFNFIKEIPHHICALFKSRCIICRPPIAQVSIHVKLTSGIIKSVCHFMSDNAADCAIIKCIIGRHVKERILQNAGRETYFIC